MREFNALAGYPEPKEPRYVSANLRTIHHRIVASYRDDRFFDGERIYGHGGLKYDGRYIPIVKNICKEYGLKAGSKVLHIGCEKGFLVHDFSQVEPGIEARGTEISDYPIEHAHLAVKDRIVKCPYTALPFKDKEFDFVIAIGPVYTLNLADGITSLKEINRVTKGHSFITLASYDTPDEYWMFKYWTLLSTLVFKKPEWLEILEHVGYKGDYAFVNAKNLKLVLKDD